MSPTASPLRRSPPRPHACRRFPPRRIACSSTRPSPSTTPPAIVDYLDALGISHCYASSYLKRGAGQHARLRRRRSDAAQSGDRRRGDATAAGSTRCARTAWGTSSTSCRTTWASRSRPTRGGRTCSRTARARATPPIFDIDWHPLKPELENKVLLPVLGDRYGAVLERQEIQLEYEHGAFRVRYFDTSLPIAPGTYDQHPRRPTRSALLERDRRRAATTAIEFLSILTAIRHLPGRDVARPDAARRARPREGSHQAAAGGADRARRRRCWRTSSAPSTAFNGAPGDPRSFDALDALLVGAGLPAGVLARGGARKSTTAASSTSTSWPRSAWRIRRSSSARMRSPSSCCARGCVDGFRIDHVDGLYDPGDYLQRLQARAQRARGRTSTRTTRRFYVVVEKILGLDEELPTWPVDGTTGYDFLVDAQRPVRRSAERARAQRASTSGSPGCATPFREIAYRGKQLVLRVSMAERAERARAPAQPLLRAQPPLPRLHAEQPDARDARDHRLLPGLPHLRQRARAGQRARPRVHRARGARGQAPQPEPARRWSSTSSATCC